MDVAEEVLWEMIHGSSDSAKKNGEHSFHTSHFGNRNLMHCHLQIGIYGVIQASRCLGFSLEFRTWGSGFVFRI